jgi:hypothetical protein
MIRPAQGGIGQEFSAAHQAVDLGSANEFGTPIVAPYAGTITAAGQMGSGTNDAGLAIDVTSLDGKFLSRLAHNDRILVSVGQQVSKGQQLGTMGFTGYTIPNDTKGGTHCHWVLWVDGVRVNPLDYVTEERGDDVKLTKEQIIMIHKLAFQGAEPGPGLIEGWVGRELDDYVNALWSDPTYAKFVSRDRASLSRESVINYLQTNLN